jgi:major vault protein
MADERQGGDLPIKVNEFIHILSVESGQIKTIVGPTKATISSSEKIVEFNERTKVFDEILSKRPQNKIVTPKGWYTILTNPPVSDKGQPKSGMMNDINPEQLKVGKRQIIEGPSDIALWPGQFQKTIKGHSLRSNQYIVCKIYDAEDANAVIDDVDNHVVIGQQIIITGKEKSFFIPNTGMEVVPDSNGEYVRAAATLQKMEYCVLIKEDGSERYIYGPAVVFPGVDEVFREKDDNRRFRAIDLNELSGIYVKVTAPYTDEDGTERQAGQELFITGKESPIYVPRAEHSIISYGGKPVIHAVAIPSGEGRYVMDRLSSKIEVLAGPAMHLADPRKEVYIRRVLTDKQVQLWYPGNEEARAVNAQLRGEEAMGALNTLNAADSLIDMSYMLNNGPSSNVRSLNKMASSSFAGDKIARSDKFTKPRTLEIDTKYDGVVRMDVFPGYAVMLKDAADNKRVIMGPQTALLAYDEVPLYIEVSTGKPKNTDRKHSDVYLRVSANHVTDIIRAETSDFVDVDIKLSYKVNFVGDDQTKWWSVPNYVKLLCDHMRSRIKAHIKGLTIDEFYSKSTDLVRNVVLGEERKFLFKENNMEIYDVEILLVNIVDGDIGMAMKSLSTNAIKTTLKKANLALQLEEKQAEVSARRSMEEVAHKATMTAIKERGESSIAATERDTAVSIAVEAGALSVAGAREEVEAMKLEMELQRHAVDLQKSAEKQDLKVGLIKVETAADVEKIDAMSKQLAPALHNLGESQLQIALAKALGDVAVFRGDGLIETGRNLFGKNIVNAVSAMANKDSE